MLHDLLYFVFYYKVYICIRLSPKSSSFEPSRQIKSSIVVKSRYKPWTGCNWHQMHGISSLYVSVYRCVKPYIFGSFDTYLVVMIHFRGEILKHCVMSVCHEPRFDTKLETCACLCSLSWKTFKVCTQPLDILCWLSIFKLKKILRSKSFFWKCNQICPLPLYLFLLS